MSGSVESVTKDFVVVDCDGHIFEPPEVWSEYVEPAHRDVVRRSLWREDTPGGWEGWLNGEPHLHREANGSFFGAIMTPGTDKAKLATLRMAKDPYDIAPGSYDPNLRLRDMDAMGIDQAVLLPTFCGMWFTAIEDPLGASALARAYNRWIIDYAGADPQRLYPAMILPQHDNDHAIAEIRWGAEHGIRCAIVRPNIVAGRHPAHPSFDPVWRAIADHDMVAGVHPFPAANGRSPAPQDCTGWFIDRAANAAGFSRNGIISESLCFGHDAQVMLLLMAHHDFFAKHPDLKLAVLESNAAWLPFILQKADGRVAAWEATRGTTVTVPPSVGFQRNGFVSFESDEDQVFELWRHFEHIGIWASDYPHFDAEDAWEAIEHMRRYDVPEAAIVKMMGANAARMYGFEPRLFVTEGAVTRC
jgi:predicted TIM-barrel fold metal-dependent hydrolase